MNSYTTTTSISISIPSFTDKLQDKKTVTFYNVEVINSFSKSKWTLLKRYNDFKDLHANLNKLYPNCPSIPGKSFFKVTANDELNKRKNHLEQFLKESVVRKDIMNNEEFRNFIEIDAHSPEFSGYSPVKVSELAELPLGVRDFIYLKYEKVIILAVSDMNITSRVDAYLTNVNFPWEKKTDTHVTVGALMLYRFKVDNNSHSFEKLWVKSYPTQTSCLYWEGEKNFLAVGLDSGKIKIYKIAPEMNFMQYDEICELKPHNHRVMGISIEPRTGYIYSCGSDKKLKVSEINYQEAIADVNVGSHGCTALIYDRKNMRLFITNEVGVVFIYSTTTNPPTLVNSVQCSCKASIRGFHIDYLKTYIFTASNNGSISVLDLSQPGKERFIKELSSFETKKKMRVAKYNGLTNELICADEDGKVSFWSLKTLEPMCVFEAHVGAVCQLYWDEENRVLISGAKDKAIRFWKIPDTWRNQDVSKFEERETKILKDTEAMIKIQRALTKTGDEFDSEDDLNGWDIR